MARLIIGESVHAGSSKAFGYPEWVSDAHEALIVDVDVWREDISMTGAYALLWGCGRGPWDRGEEIAHGDRGTKFRVLALVILAREDATV